MSACLRALLSLNAHQALVQENTVATAVNFGVFFWRCCECFLRLQGKPGVVWRTRGLTLGV